jgi:hypothetical protein
MISPVGWESEKNYDKVIDWWFRHTERNQGKIISIRAHALMLFCPN